MGVNLHYMAHLYSTSQKNIEHVTIKRTVFADYLYAGRFGIECCLWFKYAGNAAARGHDGGGTEALTGLGLVLEYPSYPTACLTLWALACSVVATSKHT